MIDPTTISIGGLAGRTASDAEASRQSLANDFDEFLTLLTTQLQNQDPLDPMDSDQMTEQLVQFSQLEQQIQQSESLESIRDINEASVVNSAINFVGKSIRYEGNQFVYDGSGEIDLNYFLAGDAANTSLTILDENGNQVFQTSGAVSQGEHPFVWDGLTDDELPAAAGNYTFQVGATDLEDNAVQTSALVPGKVDGIEVINGTVFLTMSGNLISLDSILSVSEG